MNAYLKIKIVSLAAESKIIRKESAIWRHRARRLEGRVFGVPKKVDIAERERKVWLGLDEHRRGIVRSEARASHIAYGFIRGTAYKAMEPTCYTAPDWFKIEKLILRYGELESTDGLKDRLKVWQNA